MSLTRTGQSRWDSKAPLEPSTEGGRGRYVCSAVGTVASSVLLSWPDWYRSYQLSGSALWWPWAFTSEPKLPSLKHTQSRTAGGGGLSEGEWASSWEWEGPPHPSTGLGQVKSTLGPRGRVLLQAGRSSAGTRGGSQCLFSVPGSLCHFKFYINGIIQCHFSMSLNLAFIFLKLFVSIFHIIILLYFSSLTFSYCPSIEFDLTQYTFHFCCSIWFLFIFGSFSYLLGLFW